MLDFSQATGLDVSDALAAVRTYQSRPGVSLNLEQQVTETVGLFARAGWADGNVEPWDNTDIDRAVEAGLSFNGEPWNRPDDTVGIAGVINGRARERVVPIPELVFGTLTQNRSSLEDRTTTRRCHRASGRRRVST
jgi:hypothetical protein